MNEVVTRRVEKHRYSNYLHKAASFYSAMKHCEQAEEWNGACLNAIHCAISSCDAMTTFHLGERSAGRHHQDCVELLRKIALPEVPEKAKQLLAVIELKNLIEYEPDEPTEKDARRIAKQAERIYQWAKQTLTT